jgi:hypothetical protein
VTVKGPIRSDTEFDWGDCRVREVGVPERRSTEVCAEDFGLSLAEGKVILREILRVILLDQVEEIREIERLCQTHRALEELGTLFRFAMLARERAGGGSKEAALWAAARTLEIQTCLTHILPARVNYGRRRRQGKAVSTSRAEGLVNEIADVCMAKKQRMRWSSWGAHSVATVRAAILQKRLLARPLKAA